jgi:hypothetical protein
MRVAILPGVVGLPKSTAWSEDVSRLHGTKETEPLMHYQHRLPILGVRCLHVLGETTSIPQKWVDSFSALDAHFRFILLLSSRHFRNDYQRDNLTWLSRWWSSIEAVQARVGILCLEIPFFIRYDLDYLKAVLKALPKSVKVSIFFGHYSWYQDGVFKVLRRHNIALCWTDTGVYSIKKGEQTFPRENTTSWGFLRLWQTYNEEQVLKYYQWLTAQNLSEAYVLFGAQRGCLRAAEMALQLQSWVLRPNQPNPETLQALRL